jgi:hypothetical protein
MKYARTARLGAGATATDRPVSLQEVVAWMRECRELHVVFYQTRTNFQVCVGDTACPRAQRLKHFPPDRKDEAAAWLHRTILMHYPDSRYAARYGKAADAGDWPAGDSVLTFRSR